jgi:hypothetical protein
MSIPKAKDDISPKQLVKEVLSSNQIALASVLNVCRVFTRGWDLYQRDRWSDVQVEEFLTTLYSSGFGPDPTDTILKTKKDPDDKFKITSRCGSFYTLLSIGSSELFEDAEVVRTCKVTGKSVLYALTRFHRAWTVDKGKTDKFAKSRVIKLLQTYGSELTREIVHQEIASIHNKPQALAAPIDKMQNALAGTKKYSDLVAQGRKFKSVLLTPPASVLDEIDGADPTYVLERYGFTAVRDANTQVTVQGNGQHLSALLKLSRAMQVTAPKIYCLTRGGRQQRVLDVTIEELVITNQQLVLPNNDETSDNGVLIRKMCASSDTNLHLFARDDDAEWTTCDGEI